MAVAERTGALIYWRTELERLKDRIGSALNNV